jgi:tRNA(Ile)-lysidine synthetase-like protein
LLESFLSYPSKKRFRLANDIEVFHDAGEIQIENITSPPLYEFDLGIGKKIRTSVGLITARKVKTWEMPKDANTAFFKFNDITGRQLLVRSWKHGDKMKPFGMKSKSRLISDILSEAGIKTERMKYFVPLVVFKDEPELIIWIPGIRSSEFGRLSSNSETALELRRII